MPLQLALLGAFQLSVEGVAVPFPLATARALLAYLAVEARRAHDRELVATMLWPEQSQNAAYANLRQTLARARKALAPKFDLASLVAITPQSLQWTGGADMVDAARFGQLVDECMAHNHTTLVNCTVCAERLCQAVELYRGELLHGLFLDQSQPFEEWLVIKREQLHRQAIEALHTLTLHHEAAAEYEQMRHYAARAVALEPWHEEAYRHLMRSLALSDERGAALAAYEACRRVLNQELGVEPAAETSALYEQIKAGALHPSATTHVAPAAISPLPIPPTPLLGRDTEFNLIVKRLKEPTCQLVTLTGPGGVGKTHLSLAVGRALQGAFADGAVFVSLAPTTDPDQVIPVIAHTLGIHEQHGQSLFASLTGALHDKDILVLLDNFEQVIDAAPYIGDLLARLPRIKVLVTSRATLQLRAEHEITVPPLASPAPPWNARAIAHYPAVALFVQRAEAIQPTFALSDANAPAIAEICVRLDGLPLAIELAAARIKLLSPKLLLQRLVSRLDVLTSGKRDMPARHHTLRNTIEWSYNLLEAHEQKLFARLGVFVGGGTIEAAEAVCQVEGERGMDIFSGVQALLDNSLLREAEGEDGAPRFAMLEMIREYGAERLLASGDAVIIQRRHARYFLQLAEQAAPELAGGPAQIAWFARIGAELDNIRAALRWALEQNHVVIVLRLAVAVREFWMTRAYLREGRSWIEAGLRLSDHTAQPVGDTLLGEAFNAAGWLAANARDFAGADALFQRSLALAQRSEEPKHILAVLGNMGQAARMQGDSIQATKLYKESLALSREIGDMRSMAWALCNLGIIAHAAGGNADQLLKEGVAVAQTLGDRICMAWCMTFLARVAKDRGDYIQSAAIFAETIVLFRDVGHTDGIAFTLEGWAGLAATMGDHDAAARIFGAAEALREVINRPQAPYHGDLAASIDTTSATWQAAWAEGRTLPTEQAIAMVLGEFPRVAL